LFNFKNHASSKIGICHPSPPVFDKTQKLWYLPALRNDPLYLAMNDTKPKRRCNHPDCQKAGIYPAPKAQETPRDFIWFCLEHIRDYNAKWNYFGGFSRDQIEHEIRHATVWERPTWPFGKGPLSHQAGQAPSPIPRPIIEALATMGLMAPTTRSIIKAKYRKLAKEFHPDANGGRKDQIEKFHRLQQAFATADKYYATKRARKNKTEV